MVIYRVFNEIKKVKFILKSLNIYIITQFEMDNNFGRPEDKDIEKQFMRKIRGDKLQTINAECELEICLAFRDGPKQANKHGRKKKNQKDNDEDKIGEVQLVLMGSEKLDADSRTQLIQKFKKYKQEWKFEQIEENQQLPEYFFDDGSDLSYILNSLQKDDPEQYKFFSVEQLLFLEFLCLWARGLLTKNVKEYYIENMDYMIQGMNTGLRKIVEKLKLTAQASQIKNIEMDEQREQVEQNQQIQSMIDEEQVVSSSKNNQKPNKETLKKKKISKQPKSGKKGKKKKSKKVSSQEQEDNSEGQQEAESSYPKEKQLAIKTCNYICWAYWYIIKREEVE